MNKRATQAWQHCDDLRAVCQAWAAMKGVTQTPIPTALRKKVDGWKLLNVKTIADMTYGDRARLAIYGFNMRGLHYLSRRDRAQRMFGSIKFYK